MILRHSIYAMILCFFASVHQEAASYNSLKLDKTSGSIIGAITVAAAAKTAHSWYHTYKQQQAIWKHPYVQELLQPDAPKKTAIFDMGGVLVTLHKTRLGLAQTGSLRLARYFVTHLRTPQYIKQAVLGLYSSQNSNQGTTPEEQALKELIYNYAGVKVENGTPLPDLITAFQAGLKTAEECVAFITQKSDALYKENIYKSLEEKEIILSLAKAPFNAHSFAHHTSLVPMGAALLKACKEAGHTIMICSNWDKHSFELVKQKYWNEIFQYIEPQHIIVSGAVNKLKPSKDMYTHVIACAQQAPSECVFFDDLAENRKAAETCGIRTVPFIIS